MTGILKKVINFLLFLVTFKAIYHGEISVAMVIEFTTTFTLHPPVLVVGVVLTTRINVSI